MTEPHAEHAPAGGRTLAQNRRMWKLVGELNRLFGAEVGEMRLRVWVRQVAGHECTRRLSAAQASEVLDALAAEVKQATKARRAPAPDEPPTAAQQRTAEAYRLVMGLSPMGLQKLCKKVNAEHPWPQTRAEGIKLCEALKGMWGRKLRREEGFARSVVIRCEQLAQGPATDWEQRFLSNVAGQIRAGLVPRPGAVEKLAEIDAKAHRAPGPEGV